MSPNWKQRRTCKLAKGAELDLESRKALAKKLYIEDGIGVQEIAEDPRIDRHFTQVYRWRKEGRWDQEKQAKFLQEKIEANEDIEISDLEDLEGEALVKGMMQSLDIDWDSTKPLSEEEFWSITGAIIKKLLESALKGVVSGDVTYSNPYQVQNLLELLMKEFHLAKGQPTEISEKVHIHVLPEEDEKAILEAQRRMKQIAERRRDQPLLMDGEDDNSSGS